MGSKWKLTSSEEYVFIDEEELKMQKGVLKLIVKQITANLMAGKSIMTMSLPVEIFDDHSALEGFAKIFGFVPEAMRRAVAAKEISEQIRWVAMAFMFFFACNPKVCKPFNPILGETFEGSLGGIPLYMEQISHHPPISAFFMKTDQFSAHGNIDLLVDIGLNSASTKVPAPFFVSIPGSGAEYMLRLPDIEVGGIMFGERSLRLAGRGFVLERNSGTYLEYSVGKARKGLYEGKVRSPDLLGGVF